MPTTTFPVKQAKALSQKLRKAAAPTIIDIDDRFTYQHVDALNLLDVLPYLRLKPGYTLHTQQYSDGYNASGFTWAYPDTAPLPPDHLTAWPDEKPPHAEPPMAAIAGNGSPWSYLAASLLAREVDELGARWHGCSWSEHELYTGGPLPGAPGEWHHTAPRPGDYRPTVTIDQAGAVVTFYTITGLGQHRIEKHTDTYRPDRSLQFDTETQIIATGPPGFIF